MTAPDFAAILAPWQTFTASDGATGIRIREASELLAAKVPELCPTCGGKGRQVEYVGGPLAECPGCPTIGRLIAIGAAVIGAVAERDAAYNGTAANTKLVSAIEDALAVQP